MLKLYGMEGLQNAVEAECKCAVKFSNTNMKPHHKIMHIDEHQGRTSALEYIADVYRENDIMDFSSSQDDYLELSFSGTYDNYQDEVSIVRRATDFANTYNGIVGIDAVKLIAHKQEAQWTEFLNFIKTISKSAVIVFFVPAAEDKQIENYISAIKSVVRNIDDMGCTNYTSKDYAQILKNYLHENGICIEVPTKTVEAVICAKQIESVHETLQLAEEVAELVDFSVFPPVLSNKVLKTYGGIK